MRVSREVFLALTDWLPLQCRLAAGVRETAFPIYPRCLFRNLEAEL
jgi:hypothetical protein